MHASRRSSPHLWLLFLLPICASAWTRSWWAPDEPRYAEVAREIYASGEFLVMHLCGEVYRNKPPLLFWMSGFLGSLAHWNEFAMRLPSILATLASAWMTARLARRFWGEDEARLAPILYLTSAMVTWHGARMQIDPLLGALCFGALTLASEPWKTERSRSRASVAAGFLTGLGVLAKGPIALLLVGLPLLGWRWIAGRKEPSLSRSTRALTVFAALAPGLSWALAVVARKPELAYDLFVGQFFARAVAGTNHVNPFWYHFELQPLLMLPWLAPVLGGSWLAWRALRARFRGESFDLGLALAGFWFWSLLLAFSLSPEKRDLYLLPAFPAVALLGARWIVESVRVTRAGRVIDVLVPAVLVLAGIALCSAQLFEARLPLELRELDWQPIVLGLPLAGAAAFAAILIWRGEHVRGALALAAGVAFSTTATAILIFPSIDPLKSARGLSAVLAARSERPSAIPTVGVMPEGYRFYSGRPVVHGPSFEATATDAVATLQVEFLEIARGQGKEFLALVQRNNWENWSDETRSHFAILHEQMVGRRLVMILGAR
ncbi:MAG TPA: glycosyltransferase family 39 protein [Planctomycetota bacterium]|nr:glycosyltransferase family 39 protein [Planctomycetota bacterium]